MGPSEWGAHHAGLPPRRMLGGDHGPGPKRRLVESSKLVRWQVNGKIQANKG